MNYMGDLLDIPIQTTPQQPKPVSQPTSQQPQMADIPIQQANQQQSTQQPSEPAIEPITLPPQPAPPPKQIPQVPSVEEMETNLQMSGNLLQGVKIDPNDQEKNQSPLAALQPENMINTQIGPQPIKLPSKNEQPVDDIKFANTTKVEQIIDSEFVQSKLFKYGKTVVAIALTIQGLFGIYKSIKFIMVDYPQLEALLLAHQISKSDINGFATKAIMILITTVINMFFAMKIMRNKTGQILNTIIGIILFLTSAFIDSFLSSHYDVASFISEPIVQGAESANTFTNRLLNLVPFLKKTSSGQIESVWYK